MTRFKDIKAFFKEKKDASITTERFYLILPNDEHWHVSQTVLMYVEASTRTIQKETNKNPSLTFV